MPSSGNMADLLVNHIAVADAARRCGADKTALIAYLHSQRGVIVKP